MIDKWIIQETRSKNIVKVINGSIDEAFVELKNCGDNGKGYSLTTAPMFSDYDGIKYHD